MGELLEHCRYSDVLGGALLGRELSLKTTYKEVQHQRTTLSSAYSHIELAPACYHISCSIGQSRHSAPP
jgi:hypothetical protein